MAFGLFRLLYLEVSIVWRLEVSRVQSLEISRLCTLEISEVHGVKKLHFELSKLKRFDFRFHLLMKFKIEDDTQVSNKNVQRKFEKKRKCGESRSLC